MDNYTSKEIMHDAIAFAESRFGQHYLARLNKARERCLADAVNLDLSDSYRLHRASQAAAIADEIEYFEIAQKISDDPKLMQRLIDKLKQREEKKSVI